MSEKNVTGFIADAPNVLIRSRKTRATYTNLTATSGEITFGGDTLKVTGGWSFYNLAEIDKSKSITGKFTDAEMNMSSLAIASGGSVSQGKSEFEIFGDSYQVNDEGKITINDIVKDGSLRINGYEQIADGNVGEGQFKVSIGKSSTIVELPPSDKGTIVSPSYTIDVDNITSLSVQTDDFPKSGEVIIDFPVYAGSEEDEQEITGYLQIIIYKAKILQSTKVGGNYKTASTFDVQINGLDPKRPDKKMYDIRFKPISNTVDTIPPAILSVVPADKSTSATNDIIWTFNEPIDPATVTLSKFSLISTDGSNIKGTLTLSDDRMTVTLKPNVALNTATKYLATVSGDVTDLAGNRLGDNFTTSFTTATS
ncbi:hypothetical protein BJV85_002874 [Clostridium acetobutylicum]|uniref:SbsA Ig-like domain-containing protein n=1 Tax=Clostridium acetobutylicum (strain ATCC 824 / DSM 792 / JCM 1419 / IAM 19013 / LMG 5710 / NBRC 13948 / NRRL B-527 / VKM B-1787 / 2291 / W) TaxID=272562 RepID=Q97JZ8_CLOAB|nr:MULTISPECIES: Ig-like domain-containing protein [Clostridium]AAK79097.1 Hypothetical protein CA_C1124 [Clostridium acetobutylicum ATCC 824]ADZ20173.1 Conserved hypothetical protein [Clostridium acetobutylicum EA 2018]AEI31634.1 hypothetical protein SMB_G1143 [Clostridium acetobutylicum DSM 1731]AWV81649.1 hypothetical protein DK921_16435 [Clostridium acetobutylicum]MBC2393295.1 Ig-like domain-containing protein [Clostridium acetobutylicum]